MFDLQNSGNKIKLAVMQPYFFPYIGYFQVMNAVDKYIVYDDVNYIKGGRINRNTILVGGAAKPINLLLDGASPNKLINEIELLHDKVAEAKFLKTLTMNYSKAPYFETVFPMIEKIMNDPEKNLAVFHYNTFKVLCEYMGITTELILSSTLDKDCSLKSAEKLYHICEIMNAGEYYNSINGQELYSHEEFEKRGLKLHFLKANDDIVYKQFKNEFVPNLSIIDVMMFNSVEEIQKLLTMYTLS